MKLPVAAAIVAAALAALACGDRGHISPPDHGRGVRLLDEAFACRERDPGRAARLLAERYSIPHISTGDLLRSEIAANTAIGGEIAQSLQQWFATPANQRLLEDLQELGFSLAAAAGKEGSAGAAGGAGRGAAHRGALHHGQQDVRVRHEDRDDGPRPDQGRQR